MTFLAYNNGFGMIVCVKVDGWTQERREKIEQKEGSLFFFYRRLEPNCCYALHPFPYFYASA